MSDTQPPKTFADAHVAWLVCLYAVFSKIRREGLMSIEWHVESPEEEHSLFRSFPQTLEQPYLEFATDVLRMMVGGNLNADELKVYADHYIANLMTNDGASSGGVNESLLRTIWLSLWAATSGYAPQIAVEFGRQAVPTKLKPSFIELENLLREARTLARQHSSKRREGSLDAAVDSFVASLDE